MSNTNNIMINGGGKRRSLFFPLPFIIKYFVPFAFLLLGIVFSFSFSGTGDSGDSVMHFLIAESALQGHPELFFHHWGKPVFTLFSTSFAQFGFVGIKLFNVLVVFFTLLFSQKIAALLNYERSWLVGIFLLLSPDYFMLIFSGLTEFLFGLFLVLSIFLVLKEEHNWAAILISFLPFVRTEGMGIVLVFAVYFLIIKRWKVIPYLLVGNVLYGIAGYWYYENLLWFFSENPYDPTGSVYGKGSIFHFADKLYYIIGPILYGLFGIGVIRYFFDLKLFKNRKIKIAFLLILGCFATYFIGHSLMWYLGRFGSMGLKRVLNAILPLLATISLVGFNTLLQFIPSARYKQVVGGFILGVLVFLPFSKHPIAFDRKNDFSLTNQQVLSEELADYLKTNIPDYQERRLFYSFPYLSLLLEIDHFNWNQHRNLNQKSFRLRKSGDLIIWNYILEEGLSLERLKEQKDMEVLKEFNASNERIKMVLMQVK